MKPFIFLITFCTISAAIAADAPTWPRERLLAYSWEQMGTDSATTLQQLRLAVAKNPHDVEVYAALIHMLSFRQDDEADQISRIALKLNPGNPILLIAHAQALPPSPALDVLAELARIPGQKQEADRLSEMVSLGLHIPWRYELQKAYTYNDWADRLLSVDKVDRAEAVLDEGIARSTDRDAEALIGLLARKAMIFALQKRFDDAIEIQKNLGFPQIEVEEKYVGLADVLLLMNKPGLAIDSFGNKPPEPAADFEIRNGEFKQIRQKELARILAWAYAATGKLDQAVAILSSHPEPADKLLLIRIYVNAGKVDAATAIGDELVKSAVEYASEPRVSSMPVNLPPDSVASLAPYYIWSVRWIMDHHPDQTEEIVGFLGSPSHTDSSPHWFRTGIVPTSELVPKLHTELTAALATGNTRKIADCRRELIEALRDAHEYEEAAQEAAPLAIVSSETSSYGWGHAVSRLNGDAVQWCILRRKADAYSILLSHPETLISANELLEIPGDRFWNQPHLDDGLSTDDRINRVIQLGPNVLSVAFYYFEPNTISGEDRSPYARIIAALGSRQDTPVLIDTMSLIEAQIEGGIRNPTVGQDNADSATIRQIEIALEKLTGEKPPWSDPVRRTYFWTNWWHNNSATIVAKAENKQTLIAN